VEIAVGTHPRVHGAVIVAEDTTGHDWDRYVSQHTDGTCDHLWGWRSIFGDVFRQNSRYLVARRQDVVAGVLPLVEFRSRLFGRFIVSLPFLNYGGLLASDDEARVALLAQAGDIARRFGGSHVELRHRAQLVPDLPSRSHKLAMTRRLGGTVDELWSALDRKVRNQVRKAQKEGLDTTRGGSELVDEFFDVFAVNMRDLGTPVYSRALFAETLRVFPETAHIFLVRHKGRAVAGSVALSFRDTVLVPWASSLREARHLCANMLLYWSMLEWATAAGFAIFDFGRSSPGAGTHQFKLQWGAAETPLHWEYVLLTRGTAPDQGPANPRFAAAIEAWKRLPLWLANRLGPSIVRHIP
jgi:FemAB-related protein (PEP-CTERM system-associated)